MTFISIIYVVILLFTLALVQSIPTVNFPDKVIGAYASWSECDSKIIDAVKQGANVVLWFSINLLTDSSSGLPLISGGPDYECVAETIKTIRDLGLDTVHMISIGGWDAPHPTTDNSPDVVYSAWKNWNENVISNSSLGFYGFDGIDWDIEGNDDLSSEYNTFTVDCLDLMGVFSQLAKNDGYFVSLVPAESYLDVTTSVFDRDLTHNYPEWEALYPNFLYHGHNAYAYLIAKYGLSTYDMISIQLYESYSHADYNVTQLAQPFSAYLFNIVQEYSAGWEIDFDMDAEVNDVNNQTVVIPTTQLVIGLANGWASSNSKALFVPTSEVRLGYDALDAIGLSPKGFVYWDIADDGMVIDVGDGVKVEFYMSKELNSILHIRT